MSKWKRISMAGADVAVTDERVADALLGYAMHLARAGAADTVSIPVAHEGRAAVADLLLGPASQIVLTESDDHELDTVTLPDVDGVVRDLKARTVVVSGVEAHPIQAEAALTGDAEFSAFDEFG